MQVIRQSLCHCLRLLRRPQLAKVLPTKLVSVPLSRLRSSDSDLCLLLTSSLYLGENFVHSDQHGAIERRQAQLSQLYSAYAERIIEQITNRVTKQYDTLIGAQGSSKKGDDFDTSLLDTFLIPLRQSLTRKLTIAERRRALDCHRIKRETVGQREALHRRFLWQRSELQQDLITKTAARIEALEHERLLSETAASKSSQDVDIVVGKWFVDSEGRQFEIGKSTAYDDTYPRKRARTASWEISILSLDSEEVENDLELLRRPASDLTPAPEPMSKLSPISDESSDSGESIGIDNGDSILGHIVDGLLNAHALRKRQLDPSGEAMYNLFAAAVEVELGERAEPGAAIAFSPVAVNKESSAHERFFQVYPSPVSQSDSQHQQAPQVQQPLHYPLQRQEFSPPQPAQAQVPDSIVSHSIHQIYPAIMRSQYPAPSTQPEPHQQYGAQSPYQSAPPLPSYAQYRQEQSTQQQQQTQQRSYQSGYTVPAHLPAPPSLTSGYVTPQHSTSPIPSQMEQMTPQNLTAPTQLYPPQAHLQYGPPHPSMLQYPMAAPASPPPPSAPAGPGSASASMQASGPPHNVHYMNGGYHQYPEEQQRYASPPAVSSSQQQYQQLPYSQQQQYYHPAPPGQYQPATTLPLPLPPPPPPPPPESPYYALQTPHQYYEVSFFLLCIKSSGAILMVLYSRHIHLGILSKKQLLL